MTKPNAQQYPQGQHFLSQWKIYLEGFFLLLWHQFQTPAPLSLLYNLAGEGQPFLWSKQQALILADRVAQKYFCTSLRAKVHDCSSGVWLYHLPYQENISYQSSLLCIGRTRQLLRTNLNTLVSFKTQPAVVDFSICSCWSTKQAVLRHFTVIKPNSSIATSF